MREPEAPSRPAAARIAGFLASVAMALFAAVSCAVSRHFFRFLTIEDGLIQDLTALYLLAAAILLAAAGLRALRRPWLALFLLLAGLLLAVGCLEEISWGQRFTGISTPELIRRLNSQHELNLHNIDFRKINKAIPIYSQSFDTVLYGAFSLLGVVGGGIGLVLARRLGRRLEPWAVLVPSCEVVLICALATPWASRGSFWTPPVYGLQVVLSLAVIAALLVLDRRGITSLGERFRRHAMGVFLLMGLTYAAIQGAPGRHMSNRPLEVRELLLAVGCFSYAAGVRSRLAGGKPDS
ncbi:MAG: hypothetical protein V1873_08050 [Verrucomicrobiota bacterium]